MDDHDQRFKALLHEFLADFLRLAVPEWADRFDTSAAEWLEQEVFPDPPSGDRRAADVVAKVPLRPGVEPPMPGGEGPWLTLIHVEIESPDSIAPLRYRLCGYYHDMRGKYGLPVLPIALLLKVGLEGIGRDDYRENYWGVEILRFQFWYVGLPALEAAKFLQGDNWLAVAMTSLMRRPRDQQVQMQADAMLKLVQAPVTPQQQHLLCECLDTYKKFDERQEQEYQTMIQQETHKEVKTVTSSWTAQGIKQGIEQGKAQGQRELIQRVLEKKFGPLSSQVKARLEAWPANRLPDLLDNLLDAPSLAALGLEDAA